MTLYPQLSTYLVNFAAEDPGDWSDLIEFTLAADAAGFDLMSVSDHVVFGERLDVYADPSQGGTRGGVQPTGPNGVWLDPLITVSYMVAITTRIRFITTILLAALRRPAVLAKMVATLDVLSSGRFEMGVGVGWQREEYEAVGLSFENRGRLLNHTIEVCQTIWRNGTASYESDELSFRNIHQMPKPVQPGGVPIWVSGTVNDRAMDRLARYGSAMDPVGRRRRRHRDRYRPNADSHAPARPRSSRDRGVWIARSCARRQRCAEPGAHDGAGGPPSRRWSDRLQYQLLARRQAGRPWGHLR